MIECTIDMEEHIRAALREDMPCGDVSACAVPLRRRARVLLICKQEGVVAGLSVFARAFQLLDPSADAAFSVCDGEEAICGQVLGVVRGDARALLSAERTALNYLQRMSGIATYTRKVVELLAGTGVMLLDTRKTTPGMRAFERAAVRAGGGSNHRFCLSDGVMLKDNHVAAAGGVRQAVEAARAQAPFLCKVEVEVETVEQAAEAAEAGADIIMLDNMDLGQMREAVTAIAGRSVIEASGNVTAERVRELASVGVDCISCGALTHSAGILDLSLKGFELLD